jgi:hypothetical protein
MTGLTKRNNVIASEESLFGGNPGEIPHSADAVRNDKTNALVRLETPFPSKEIQEQLGVH